MTRQLVAGGALTPRGGTVLVEVNGQRHGSRLVISELMWGSAPEWLHRLMRRRILAGLFAQLDQLAGDRPWR